MSDERFSKAFPVSWDQLHRDARALAWRLAGLRAWERIITVTRGGMVPACIIARELEIRLVDAIAVVSYDHMAQGSLRILKGVEPGERPERDLIIDDLVDTGTTAAAVRAMLPAAHYATVYAKPEGRELVDTFVTEVSQDTWVHLPWDTELQFVQPLVKTGRDA